MDKTELIEYCLEYAGAYEDYPFGPMDEPGSWAAMRHGAGKKAFAFIYERGGLCVNLKCEPERAEFLRRTYPWVTPAYHMNKRHWNTVFVCAETDENELRDMISRSYDLTKK